MSAAGRRRLFVLSHPRRLSQVSLLLSVCVMSGRSQGRGTAMQSNNGNARARYYWHDLKALIDGRGNHPSIYQCPCAPAAACRRNLSACGWRSVETGMIVTQGTRSTSRT